MKKTAAGAKRKTLGIMKISFPTTIDGWVKLGTLIFNKNKKPDPEEPIELKNADVAKIGALAESSKTKFAKATSLRREAESLHQEAVQELEELEAEIRRAGNVLTGRYKGNKRKMGLWGFEVDETSASTGADEEGQ